MFNAAFSFEGRISRTEYGISLILYTICYVIIFAFMENSPDNAIVGLIFIPMIWFLWAQGAKRCHDINKTGWMQIIPFYVLWMIFEAGDRGENEFGEDPKGYVAPIPVVNFQAGNTAPAKTPELVVVTPQKTEQKAPAQIPLQQITVLEVQNINYSLVQDVLRSLRSLDLTNHLTYEFIDTTAKITVNHKNTSQALLDNLYPIMDNIEVLGVGEGSIKIKLR